MYKITGRIVQINPTEVKNATLQVRTFVIETEEEYAQTLIFQTVNQKTALLDRVRVGQEITLWFSLKGRAWEDKVIVNLSCYKIEGVELPIFRLWNSTDPQSNMEPNTNLSEPAPKFDENGELIPPGPGEGDDLPF